MHKLFGNSYVGTTLKNLQKSFLTSNYSHAYTKANNALSNIIYALHSSTFLEGWKSINFVVFYYCTILVWEIPPELSF